MLQSATGARPVAFRSSVGRGNRAGSDRDTTRLMRPVRREKHRVQRIMTLTDLPDGALTDRLLEINRHERGLLVEFLRYLGEVDRRRTALAQGFPSLFSFCDRSPSSHERVGFPPHHRRAADGAFPGRRGLSGRRPPQPHHPRRAARRPRRGTPDRDLRIAPLDAPRIRSRSWSPCSGPKPAPARSVAEASRSAESLQAFRAATRRYQHGQPCAGADPRSQPPRRRQRHPPTASRRALSRPHVAARLSQSRRSATSCA